jgi:hypothetical protein
MERGEGRDARAAEVGKAERGGYGAGERVWPREGGCGGRGTGTTHLVKNVTIFKSVNAAMTTVCALGADLNRNEITYARPGTARP